LKPFLIGKDPLQIEDIFQSSFVSSYWRNGPVLGNALSGVDMALWDIVGKRANLPVYQLFGGKCRDAVETYAHTSGRTFQEVEAAARRARERGYRHIRIQVAVPGLTGTYGVGGQAQADHGSCRDGHDREQDRGKSVRAVHGRHDAPPSEGGP
jgi:mannonate dehydratase